MIEFEVTAHISVPATRTVVVKANNKEDIMKSHIYEAIGSDLNENDISTDSYCIDNFYINQPEEKEK